MSEFDQIRASAADIQSNLDSIKRRYDRYAAFIIGIQKNYSHFVTIAALRSQLICCTDHSDTDISISSYPFYYSPEFARLIHVRCEKCGTTFVPTFDFSLDEYYKGRYAEQVQPFRQCARPFYAETNDFLRSQTYVRMRERAQFHLETLGVTADMRLLDVGAGVGIALSEAKTRHRFADEPDAFSRQILREEVGAELISVADCNETFDRIVCSHMLEHLPMSALAAFLARLRRLLSPGGRLLIETPFGADQVSATRDGARAAIFEPHTIQFSARGLASILRQAGFRLRALTPDKGLNALPEQERSAVMGDVQPLRASGLVAVCELP